MEPATPGHSHFKKCGCSRAENCAEQLSALTTLPWPPPLSSLALQSPKEKGGRGALFPPCLWHVTYPGAVLQCSQCKQLCFNNAWFATHLNSFHPCHPESGESSCLLVCLHSFLIWFVLPEPKDFLFFCPNASKTIISFNYF